MTWGKGEETRDSVQEEKRGKRSKEGGGGGERCKPSASFLRRSKFLKKIPCPKKIRVRKFKLFFF